MHLCKKFISVDVCELLLKIIKLVHNHGWNDVFQWRMQLKQWVPGLQEQHQLLLELCYRHHQQAFYQQDNGLLHREERKEN